MDRIEAIVLAAGMSTRIAEIFDGQPKPMLPIAGEPVLVRNLRWLRSQGIARVHINLHHAPEAIRRVIGSGAAMDLAVNYVYEPELLGTAGAVANIAAAWTDTFAVAYGDNLLSASLSLMLEEHVRHGAPITIGVFDRRIHPHTGVAGGAVEIDCGGRVAEFREGSVPDNIPFVNAGLYLIEPALVGQIPRGAYYDFAHDLFPRMLARGMPIHAYLIDGYCLGLDTPQSYRRALEIVGKREIRLN